MAIQLKITHKLGLLLAIVMIGLISMTAMSLMKTNELLIEDRKATLKNIVQVNKKIIEHYYAAHEKGSMTEAAAKQAAYSAVGAARYNKNDYIFGYDYEGKLRISGVKPENIGKGYMDLKDPNGVYLIRDLIEAGKQGGGYVFYSFPKPGETIPSPKVGYAEIFKPWQIMVGTGAYIDDLDAAFAEERDILLVQAGLIILIIAVGGMYLGKSIAAPLKMKAMVEQFEKTVTDVVAGMSSAATEMQGSAKSLSNTAEETTRQAAAVGSASESASSGVQTVASAAEELNTSISEITGQTTETVRVARDCVAEAERTSAEVKELSKAAEDIEVVVNLIESISGQVNLLALNATIEAARAGEAGKGFAVVAGEVKNLAAQTGDATKDIVDQVSNIQDKTRNAVASINRISDTIKKVDEISTTVASAAEEQSAATQEISRSVQKTAQDTEEVSNNITGVKCAADETTAASTQLYATAQQLAEESSTLRSTVDGFIEHIRKL